MLSFGGGVCFGRLLRLGGIYGGGRGLEGKGGKGGGFDFLVIVGVRSVDKCWFFFSKWIEMWLVVLMVIVLVGW